MSYGRVVHESLAEQAGQRRELKRRSERAARASAVVLERCPELNDGRPGCPCPWAVWSMLELWREHGDRDVTPRMLRDRRREKLARFEEQRGRPAYPKATPVQEEVQHGDR